MGVLKIVGNGLRWILLQTLKLMGRIISWSARRLWKLSVRGGIFLWHRVRGESGTVVVSLDKQGTCVAMGVYNSKGLNIKDGKPLDLTSMYRKNFLNGVPDRKVVVYHVNNINPFRRRADKPLGKVEPQLRFLKRLKPESQFSLREEYWKNKNGVHEGGLSPDQHILFNIFNEQQDKLMEHSLLNLAISEKQVDKIMEIIRASAVSQDKNDFNRKIAQCEQHAADILSFMPADKLRELAEIIAMTDPSLKEAGSVERLSNVPVSCITQQQLFYFRCLWTLDTNPTSRLAHGIVEKYDFNRSWEQDGVARFHQGDDESKAGLITAAVHVNNKKSVEQMAEALFMGMFNQSNIRSRNMYSESVHALAVVKTGEPPSKLLEYFSLVQAKRDLCAELAKAAGKDKDYMFSPAYSEWQKKLECCNRKIDEVYASPQIIGLELQKVDSLIGMYVAGTVKGPDGQIRPDVADALAALVNNLHEAGFSNPVLQKLAQTDILNSQVMREALQRYMFSDDMLQQYSYNRAEGQSGQKPRQTAETTECPVIKPEPDVFQTTDERDAGKPAITQDSKQFEAYLNTIHEKYKDRVQVDFEARKLLPFPAAYIEGMMEREPDILADIIRQVGSEALAYRNGDLTAMELFNCPCYEPYYTGNPDDADSLAQRMTEYWVENTMQSSQLGRTDFGTIPAADDNELQFSADTPLEKPFLRTDEFNEKIETIVQKYKPNATFEQYCTMVCPSEKAQNIWKNPENQGVFIRLMNECVSMSMAYRNGEVTCKDLINAVPNANYGKENCYTKEYADKLSNRIMAIYEGRIHNTVEQSQTQGETAHRTAGPKRR